MSLDNNLQEKDKVLTTKNQIVVIGRDGVPLSTDSRSNFVDKTGIPYPTNYEGMGLNESVGKTLPTDETGKFIYPIVDVDGNLLKKTKDGKYLKPDGEKVTLDKFRRPLNDNGELLKRNKQGDYIFEDLKRLKTEDLNQTVIVGNGVDTTKSSEALTLPTDESGKIVYPIVDSNGKLMEVNAAGQHFNQNGESIKTDDFGRPIDKQGKLLLINSKGQYVYNMTTKSFPNWLDQFTDFKNLTEPNGSPFTPIVKDDIIMPTDSEDDLVVTKSNEIFSSTDKNLIINSQYPYPNDRDSIASNKLDKTCKMSETVADIIFAINNELLIDSQTPIKNTIKNFIVNEVDLAPDAVRLALLHFGRNLEIPVNLGGYNEKAEVLQKLKAIEHTNLEVPDLLTAYQAAEQQFKEFGRKNTTRILIIFSTGDDMYVVFWKLNFAPIFKIIKSFLYRFRILF